MAIVEHAKKIGGKEITLLATITGTTATRTVDCTSIVGYANLNVDNFMIELTNNAYYFYQASNENNTSGLGATAVNFTKAYNPTTGILTLSGLYATNSLYYIDLFRSSVSNAISIKVWLVN